MIIREDAKVCPICDNSLVNKVGNFAGSHLMGSVIRGLYDGVVYWTCPFCSTEFERDWGNSTPARVAEYYATRVG